MPWEVSDFTFHKLSRIKFSHSIEKINLERIFQPVRVDHSSAQKRFHCYFYLSKYWKIRFVS